MTYSDALDENLSHRNFQEVEALLTNCYWLHKNGTLPFSHCKRHIWKEDFSFPLLRNFEPTFWHRKLLILFNTSSEFSEAINA